MIIGISGYSGAGKDTVGRVIQYLNCSNVGDVSISEAIHAEHDWWMEEQSGWEIKKFAGKLKKIASILTGIPVEKFEDQEFKKSKLGREWGMTVRELLQKLGTEGLRTGLHENVWLNALFADYIKQDTDPDPEYEMSCKYCGCVWDPLKTEFYDLCCPCGKNSPNIKRVNKPVYDYPNWIITDCRFPNEAESIKKRKGIVIRVERPGLKKLNNHPSESSLDNWPFDYKIVNDGDLNKLKRAVKKILKNENLLKDA